jgi:hypothetical protein
MQFALQVPPKNGGEKKKKENHAYVLQKPPKNGGEEKRKEKVVCCMQNVLQKPPKSRGEEKKKRGGNLYAKCFAETTQERGRGGEGGGRAGWESSL